MSQVLLAIKDKLSSAHSDYNILLANNDEVPERRKGLNNLKHDVTVGIISVFVGHQVNAGGSQTPQQWRHSAYHHCHIFIIN